MKDVIRSYCVFVLLGKPKQKSLRTAARFALRARAIWLTPRIPLLARLLGIAQRPLPTDESLLLTELERLAEELEGKILTLVPLSSEARRFAEKHQASLEVSYRKGNTYEAKTTF